jgi:hypothetical protein
MAGPDTAQPCILQALWSSTLPQGHGWLSYQNASAAADLRQRASAVPAMSGVRPRTWPVEPRSVRVEGDEHDPGADGLRDSEGGQKRRDASGLGAAEGDQHEAGRHETAHDRLDDEQRMRSPVGAAIPPALAVVDVVVLAEDVRRQEGDDRDARPRGEQGAGSSEPPREDRRHRHGEREQHAYEAHARRLNAGRSG